MFRIHHCIIFAAALLAGCSAEPPSTTIASALGPSCQSIDAISTEHQAKVETAASASYQLVEAGARSDIGGESRVDIRFSDQPTDSCGSIQRTAMCFVGLAASPGERSAVQELWAPIISTICRAPSSVPSPDLVIPPSASSAVVP
jgi:hypothetical protein